MAYNFKKLSDVALQEATTENTNVYVDENGEMKRISANKFGAVKTVNGASPDESGNVSIEIPEGFSGSWNDLKDKPFYETEVGGDTLTWDGNTEGLTSVELGSGTAHKVSDAVFSAEDCVNGVKSPIKLPDMVISEECDISNFDGVTYVTCGPFPLAYSVPPECVGVDLDGLTFPEAGTYLVHAPFYHCSSLTIPGFGGFPSIKTLDKKYLPADIGGGNDVMIINATPIGEYTEDGQEIELYKTGEEICSAWDDGKLMFLRGLDGLLQITGVDGETCFLCYGLVIGHQMRAVGYEVYFDGNTWRAAKITPSLYDMEFVSPWIYSSNNKTYQLDVDENGNVIAIPKGGSVPS